MGVSTGGIVAASFFGGFIAALLIVAVGAFSVLRMSDAYGLGHWKLNVKVPFTTMWMNLGYWYGTWSNCIHSANIACKARANC